MKVKLLETVGSDAGFYGGMKDFRYGEVVEASWCNDRQNSIYVSGEEFIRCGGCPKAFNPTLHYMWGCFEEVN
jgi:hypothetical protein